VLLSAQLRTGLPQLLADLAGEPGRDPGQRFILLTTTAAALRALRSRRADAARARGRHVSDAASLIAVTHAAAISAEADEAEVGAQVAARVVDAVSAALDLPGEKGLRPAAHEALGLAGEMAPDAAVDRLSALTQDAAAPRRLAGVAALRHVAVHAGMGWSRVDATSRAALSLLEDEHLDVRREALRLVAGLATHRPAALDGPGLLPVCRLVCAACASDEKHHQRVDLGAFVSVEDRAQGCRVAALECLMALVDAFGSRLPLSEVIDAYGAGLKVERAVHTNQFEVVALAGQAIVRAAMRHPRDVLRSLDDGIAPRVLSMLMFTAKGESTAQERDLFAEQHGHSVRTAVALANVPGAEASAKLGECLALARKRADLRPLLKVALGEEDSDEDMAGV